MGPREAMIPGSVVRFIMDHVNLGDQLPERQRKMLWRLTIKLRNGVPSAVRLAEQFDRGEIDGDRLLAEGGR